MPAYGTFDAKNRLSELIDKAKRGEEVTITRNGKPVARLVTSDQVQDRVASAKAAAVRIRAKRKGRSLGGLKIKDLVEEGRR
jgi:prevent-host-death family protein